MNKDLSRALIAMAGPARKGQLRIDWKPPPSECLYPSDGYRRTDESNTSLFALRCGVIASARTPRWTARQVTTATRSRASDRARLCLYVDEPSSPHRGFRQSGASGLDEIGRPSRWGRLHERPQEIVRLLRHCRNARAESGLCVRRVGRH